MTREHRTRRSVLRAGGGIAAATLGGMAGCVDRFSGNEGDGNGGSSYTDWLPSAAALGIGEEFYAFSTLDVGSVVANRERFDAGRYGSFADRFGAENPMVPPVESVETVTTAAVSRQGTRLLVVRGDFSAAEAAGQLTDAGYEQTDDHGGYDLYSGSRGTFGIQDGVVAGSASGHDDVDEMVRTVIDAERGAAERLVAADDDAARLVDEFGARLNAVGVMTPEMFAEEYDPESLAAIGRSVRLAEEAAEFELVLVYDDPEGVDIDAIEATASEDGAPLGRARDVSAAASGRVATVSGTAPADRISFYDYELWLGPAPNATPPAPPEASFAFAYDDGAGTVTITHDGGESFTADNTGALRYGVPDGTLREWALPVSAGASVTLRGIESGDGVVVIWESPAGDTVPVGRFTVP